jgi:pheromone receptor transcription factor
MAEHNNSPPQDETAADVASTLTTGNGVPNSQSGVPGAAVDNSRKRPRQSGDDDDDDDDSKPGRERRKIEIKFIQDKSRRHITFSKRKAGIMKKVRAVTRLTRLVGCRACFEY